MHVYFSGIGGSGIGPLALIAKQAGYKVSGSDKNSSSYTDYLKSKGITDITIGQTAELIADLHSKTPIDWLVYSSAVVIENTDHPEIKFAAENNIKSSKRDEFLNMLLKETDKKLIAVAGTHGKTTTTAMAVWLFKHLNMPISYSLGAKVSFGDMGEYNAESKYFVYEADEYDRNFLSFSPEISLITGISYDHPDIYPTIETYISAFKDFIKQSNETYAHSADAKRLSANDAVLTDQSTANSSRLIGNVNRENASLVAHSMANITGKSPEELISILNSFPGVSRRFEKISENIYSDYAHTPEKIRGAIQAAQEVSESVVVVYEGLHNTRQHFIKAELESLFENVKQLYVVPSYLAREDKSLELLTPDKLCSIIQKPAERFPAELDSGLQQNISKHAQDGSLVLCLSAGGATSLDEWLRTVFGNLS